MDGPALRSAEAAESSASESRDEAFAAYMTRRQGSLLRTAFLLTGNRAEAEDLVQAALAKVYLHWDKVRSRDSLDGYVRRAMVNENHSMWRRPWRRREVPVADPPEQPGPDDPDPPIHDEALWDLVRALPPRQRTVVVLRYYEDLSIPEIAHTMGTSEGTVKSQASRALATLRSHPTFADLEDWS